MVALFLFFRFVLAARLSDHENAWARSFVFALSFSLPLSVGNNCEKKNSKTHSLHSLIFFSASFLSVWEEFFFFSVFSLSDTKDADIEMPWTLALTKPCRASLWEHQPTNFERELSSCWRRVSFAAIVSLTSFLECCRPWQRKSRQWALRMIDLSYSRADCLRAKRLPTDNQLRPHAFCRTDLDGCRHPNFRHFYSIPNQMNSFEDVKNAAETFTCIGRTRFRRAFKRRSGTFSLHVIGLTCWTGGDGIWTSRTQSEVYALLTFVKVWFFDDDKQTAYIPWWHYTITQTIIKKDIKMRWMYCSADPSEIKRGQFRFADRCWNERSFGGRRLKKRRCLSNHSNSDQCSYEISCQFYVQGERVTAEYLKNLLTVPASWIAFEIWHFDTVCMLIMRRRVYEIR